MTIQPRDIEALIELFESSGWDELHLKMQDFELHLSTDPVSRSNKSPTDRIADAAPVTSSPPNAMPANTQGIQPVEPNDTAAVPAHWVAVTAPNLGTFYRAPKPGAPDFVSVGQTVEPDTEICLIEVMKLFTTLKAGIKGIVRKVCVLDATMVEFGDVLFYLEPV